MIASNLFALAEASASNVHFTNAYLVNVALRAALAAAAPDNSNPFDHVCVVTAAAELVQREICDITLCGDPAVIEENARKAHVDVSRCTIVHPQDVLYDNPQPWAEEMVQAIAAEQGAEGLQQWMDKFGMGGEVRRWRELREPRAPRPSRDHT